jgi:UDP-N-acetylglucosamine--N-acetylmuramyl-(pentapeptide) pyrophosphoryl-undecaprenol N-acetylglucosamine transferase
MDNFGASLMKNIVLTGGGTGGHIYPCLAVAEVLNKLNSQLFYIGHSEKLEAQLLTKNELKDSEGVSYSSYIKFLPIKTDPVINKLNPLKLVKWLTNFYTAFTLSKKYLRENNISVVFGTGGYVAGPVFAAAIALKIPYIIHNLDSHMGLANRVFVRNAYALTLGICELGIKPQNGRVIVTGNPISHKFLNHTPRNDGTLHLLVTGGSQGAESINNAIGNLLPRLTELNIDIVHVTGAKTYQDFTNKYLDGNANKYSNYKIHDYIHNMPELCAWADLTVCRSGAMTIAEMSASGVVPIFVPLPWAAHDHQTLNAKALVDAGAAMSLDQNEENFEELLFFTVKGFVNDRLLLKEFAKALESFGKNDAAKAISELILAAQ